jgi:ABC-2 type transport system ATP-binding protein
MVEEVMADEDLLQLAAPENARLINALQKYPGLKKIHEEGGFVYATFDKGMSGPDEVNAFCFSKGISLSRLLLKKKRLETRFFELTGNESGDITRR